MKGVNAELKSQDTQSTVLIHVLGYQFPEDLDGWDADWYAVNFEVKLPSFTYQITVPGLCGLELEDFCHELQSFSAVKSFSASLKPMEPYIELELTFDSKKNVNVAGTVRDLNADSSGELQFEFKTDLPNVDAFWNGLQMTLKQFPPRRTS